MRRKWLALFIAVLMVLAMLPTAVLAAGPQVRQEYQGAVQAFSSKKVTIYSSTTYQSGHNEPGGTLSHDPSVMLTLKLQDDWTFTPHANDGYEFTGWTDKTGPSGAFSESGNNLTVSYVNKSDYNATANFNFVGFTVRLDLGNGGTFDSNHSSAITLTGVEYGTLSVPAYTIKPGYDFKGWNGSLNINSSRTLTANYEYEVNFVGNDHVTITGATPVWTISHDVTAPSYGLDPGYRFDGWNKSLNNLTGPTTITANPGVRQYHLTLDVSGSGGFLNRSAVEGTYDEGEKVWLSNALPVGNLGWAFTRWLDPETGQTYPLATQATITDDCTYIAIFESLGSRYVNAFAFGSHGKLNHNINGTYAQGTEINLNTAQPTAITPGYEFKYWEEYIDSSDSWIKVGLTGGEPIITVGVVNDYRAIFGIEDYSITYNLNGGTDPGNPSTYNIDTPTFTLNNPTKDGYTFEGWTSADIMVPTKTVTIPQGSTGDKTFTAHWSADTYNITYDLKGGTDPGNPATYTVESDDITLVNPTQDGYDFAGWTGTGLSGPTMTVTIPKGSTGDRAYTATWTATAYNLNYNLNDGTVATPNPTTYTSETPDFTLNNPTKTGYTFTGWVGTGLTGPTMTVTILQGSTGDRDFEATWSLDTYDITYHYNGGSVPAPGNPATYTYETPDLLLVNPTKDGYEFTGWTGTDLSGPTMSVTVLHNSTGDREYTATWRTKTYNLNYDLDGGTVATPNPATYTFETPDFTLNNPTKTGYTFTGWVGTGLTGPTMTVTILQGSTGDRDFTATWALDTYNITYHLDSGTDPGNPATYTYEDPDLPLANPTKDGYEFAGWTGTDLSGPTMSVTILHNSTGDREYTATWTRKDYNLSYDLDGGTDPGNPATYNVETPTFTLNNPTKDGYTFDGWTSADILVPSTNVEIPQGSTGNKAFTANWTADDQPYTVNWIVYKDRTQTDSELAMSWPLLGKTDQVIDTTVFVFDVPGYDESVDPPATLILGTDPTKNIINVYYTPQEQAYTVHYYLEGTTDQLAPDKIGTGLSYQTVTENPIDIEGYDPVSADPQSIVLWPPDQEIKNVIVFYYTAIEIIEPTAPLGPVSPEPTEEPKDTSEPTVTVSEETAPAAPVLPVTGENPLDWMLMVGGLVVVTGAILLFSHKRKQREE